MTSRLVESEKPWNKPLNKLEKALLSNKFNKQQTNNSLKLSSVGSKSENVSRPLFVQNKLKSDAPRQPINSSFSVTRRGTDAPKFVIKQNKVKQEKNIRQFNIIRRTTGANYVAPPLTRMPRKPVQKAATNLKLIHATKPLAPLRRAVLVGINYNNSNENKLNGCINDCLNLKNFLLKNKYFVESEVTLMTDDTPGVNYPVKANIMAQINSMVALAKNNPNRKVELFFSYSGHGSRIKDLNGDETSGMDNVLCPLDCLTDSKNLIVDDDLKSLFVMKLASNVSLTVLIDACHSGTMFDLRYMYKVDSKNTFTVIGTQPESICNTVMISGCKDIQTSADAYISGQSQGAMTAAFLACYRLNISYDKLITDMRVWLKNNNFDQVPMLSSGRQINILHPYLLNDY